MSTKQTQSPLRMIPLDQLTESELNPRKHFDADALKELVNSIQSVGVISPILVSELEQGDQFVIIAGHRRAAAAELAGLTEVPAYVHDGNGDLALAVAENVIREDLTPLEEASAYQLLVETHGDVEKVAALVGKDVRTVRARLELNDLPEPVREALVPNGSIPLGCAPHLVTIASHSPALAVAVAGIISEDKEELLLFPDWPARAVDLALEEGVHAWSVGSYADPIIPSPNERHTADVGLLLDWVGDGRMRKAWDALGELPAEDTSGYSYSRQTEVRRRLRGMEPTVEQLDAARSYGCLLELPDDREQGRLYLTDPAWIDEHLGERLEAVGPPASPTPAGRAGGAENRSQTPQAAQDAVAAGRAEAAEAAYQARTAARARNLALGAALTRYEPKVTLDEMKLVCRLALDQVGPDGPWAMRLCQEQPTKQTKAGKEVVTYPRGGEARQAAMAAARDAIERAKTPAQAAGVLLRLVYALHLVDVSGLVQADREGVYEPHDFQVDPRIEKLATRVAPPVVKQYRKERSGD